MNGPQTTQPAWIWIPDHGWFPGMMGPDGCYFEEKPPPMPVGMKIIAVSREPGEAMPDPLETARLLTSLADHL
jgi:hypothetical protein